MLNKTIALIDPNSSGHHRAYMHSFIGFFLKKGYKIVVFMPDCSVFESGQVSAVDYRLPMNSLMNRLNRTVHVVIFWIHLARQIRRFELLNSQKVSFVFFAWMDNYLANRYPYFFHKLIFPWKWSGLLFHARHLRYSPGLLKETAKFGDVDSVFKAENCVGIGIHDPGIRKGFEFRFGKPVHVFPEIADITKPDYLDSTYLKIKDMARGRLVVGMIGLAPHQGMMGFCKLQQHADPDRFLFVFAGPMNRKNYSDQQLTTIEQVLSAENVFSAIGVLEEGEEYNSVFNAMDIVYLVYRNFTSPSNRLTKAAYLEKFVLASDEHILGEEVRNFNLGITVPWDDDKMILEGLNKSFSLLRSKKESWVPKWNAYRAIHSQKTFNNVLESISQLIQ